MAKKSSHSRKPSGAAGIAVIEDDLDNATDDVGHEKNGSQPDSHASAAKPARSGKAKPEQQSNEHFAKKKPASNGTTKAQAIRDAAGELGKEGL